MAKYAKARKAWGECARSGRRMLLKDMVPDGNKPGLMVDPAWRDKKHPIEKNKPMDDAVALKRPAPDLDDDSAGDSGVSVATALFPGENVFGGGT